MDRSKEQGSIPRKSQRQETAAVPNGPVRSCSVPPGSWHESTTWCLYEFPQQLPGYLGLLNFYPILFEVALVSSIL